MGSSLALLLLESLGVARGLWTIVTAFSAVCVGLLYITTRMPRWAILAIFSLETILALAGSWFSAEGLGALGRPFSPFTPVKIVGLVVAILCPSLWLGIALIGVAAVLPIVQTLHWTPAIRDLLPQLEPTQSVLFAAFSVPCLILRRRHAALRQELTRAHAEDEWLERLVRLALHVRALTRAPLETIGQALAGMRRNRVDIAPTLARMENAVARLELMNETIAPLGRLVPEQPGAVVAEEISRLLRELSKGRQPRAVERPTGRLDAEARRAAIYVTGLGVVAGILFLAQVRIKGYPSWPTVLIAVPGAVLVSIALACSDRPRRFYLALFAVHELFALAFSCVAEAHNAQRGPYDAFIYIKFYVMVCAFLAPSGFVGGAFIGLATLAAIAEAYLWFSPVQRSQIPVLEPWLTVLIGLTALGLLAGQRQDAATVRQLAQARAYRAWMSRVARLALSVRDLANTPLQVLWLQLAVLRRTDSPPELAEMEASLARLRQLNETLAPLAAMVEWGAESTSFDALENIAAEVRATLRDGQRQIDLLVKDRARPGARW